MSKGKYNKQNGEEDLLDLGSMESGSTEGDLTSNDTDSENGYLEEDAEVRTFKRDARIIGGHKLEQDDDLSQSVRVNTTKDLQTKEQKQTTGAIGDLSDAQKAKIKEKAQSVVPTRTMEEAKQAHQAQAAQKKQSGIFSFLNFGSKKTDAAVSKKGYARGNTNDGTDSDTDEHSDDSTHGLK